MRLKNVLLTQKDEKSCGEAVFKMLLAYIQQDYNYLTISLPTKFDNFLLMKKKGESLGLSLEGRRYENIEYLKEVKGPFILQTSRNGVNHFLLGLITKDKIKINDPSGEYYVLSLKMLEKYFISNILVVNCVENVRKPPPVKFKYSFMPLLFHGLFLLFIILGFAFLGIPGIDLLSYIFFTLAGILKIIEQQIMMMSFQKFSKKYVMPKLEKINGNFKQKFYALHQAKEMVFGYPLKLFSSFSTILLITVLLVINNYFLLTIAFYLIIFALIDHQIKTYLKDRDYDLNIKMSDFMIINPLSRPAKYDEIINESVLIAKRYVYFDIIVHFGLGVLIILLMYFTNNFTLNFLTFYFFGFGYYYYELKKMFSLVFTKKDYYKAINIITNE